MYDAVTITPIFTTLPGSCSVSGDPDGEVDAGAFGIELGVGTYGDDVLRSPASEIVVGLGHSRSEGPGHSTSGCGAGSHDLEFVTESGSPSDEEGAVHEGSGRSVTDDGA